MNDICTKNSKLSLMAIAILFFAGCDMFKKKDESSSTATASESSEKSKGPVLLSVDGKPAITEEDFNNSLAQMLQANSYMQGATPDSLPTALKRKFFEELIKQEMIAAFGEKNKLETRPEFVKSYKEMKKQLKRAMYVQFFNKEIYDQIKVDDEKIAQHYNENKARYVKDAGGVNVMGIRFEKEDAAKAFLDKAKASPSNFKDLAKADKNGKFKDFERVNKQERNPYGIETVPAPIKEAAFATKDMPSVQLVKVGKDFWVIKSSDRQEPVIFDLDEIKSQVESILKNNLFREELDQKLKQLKGDIKLDVNEDFFKKMESSERARAGEEQSVADDAMNNEPQDTVSAA